MLIKKYKIKGWPATLYRDSLSSTMSLKRLSNALSVLVHPSVRLSLFKIKAKDKITINFSLNPLQKELEEKIQEVRKQGLPARFIILKPRQIGCTTYFSLKNFCQCYFSSNQFCAIIAHLREKAHEIFNQTVKFIYDNTNKGLKIPAYNDATHHLGWRSTQSQIKVTSEGHGITPNLLHLTEVAHMRDPKNMILEALQGVPLNSGFVVMESTANGRGGFFHDVWTDAISDPESVWIPIFLEWWKHPDYKLPVPANFRLTKEEKDLLEKFQEKGLTKENLVFRRLKIIEGGRDKVDPKTGLTGYLSFQQNYPMTPQEAFILPTNCLFNIESLHWMDLNKPKPLSIEQVGRGWLKVFGYSDKKKKYIIAVDTAFGASSDYSVAIVLEKDTKKIVATLRGKWGSCEFASSLLKLGKFYNTALIAVERNMGQAVLNELINHSDYENIYYNEEFDQFRNKIRKPGFYTSNTSRNLILSALEEAIRTKEVIIPDDVIIGECLNFGMKGRKFEAISGNDDCVMALAIGVFLCNEARDYHIETRLEKPLGI